MSRLVLRSWIVLGCVVAVVGLCGDAAWAETDAVESVAPAAEIAPAVEAEPDVEIAPDATETDDCSVCRAKHAMEPSWLKWGLDERLRWTYIENPGLRNGGIHLQDYRTRLWTTVTPVENLDLNARLVWQFTNFCRPDGVRDKTPSSDVPFDLLNVTWTQAMGQPVTVIAGRQEIRLGDGWLVADGTPLDEFRTAYFDAIRFIWDIEQADTTVNLIYIRNRADSGDYVKPFNNVDDHVSDLNESGAILYVRNTSMPYLELDGYFIYKHDNAVDAYGASPGHRSYYGWMGWRQSAFEGRYWADIYTFGARAGGQLGDRWSYRGEAAFQFGDKANAKLCGAWGANTRVAFLVDEDTHFDIHVGYEYRSGGRDERSNFDMLWGRYAQWSVLYTETIADLDSYYGQDSNLHRAFLGAAVEPVEDLTIGADYHALFADRDNVDWWGDDGYFRGHLITSQLHYRFNEHLAGTLRAELFAPGDYYGDFFNETAFLARYETSITW